ncbi:myosin-binding protein H-like [Anneissia japonica]|uniref:myosin-binding protein H-like n=1 Tax=Anneissia japonica TaxID=1529436 RepID=UPI001425B1FD|nr:myosin-binding protein H-like [Anneissia japonica]
MKASSTYVQGNPPRPTQAFSPPPKQEYAPPPLQGYVPPPQEYTQQQGYQVTQGCAPPAQPRQAFAAPPAVIFINAQQISAPAQPAVHTTIVRERPRQRVNHPVHFVITLLFWPWIVVWIIICIVD